MSSNAVISEAVDYLSSFKAHSAEVVTMLPSSMTRSATVSLGQRTMASLVLAILVSKLWMSVVIDVTMSLTRLTMSPILPATHIRVGRAVSAFVLLSPFGKHSDVTSL